jgi:hypothetical protein
MVACLQVPLMGFRRFAVRGPLLLGIPFPSAPLRTLGARACFLRYGGGVPARVEASWTRGASRSTVQLVRS